MPYNEVELEYAKAFVDVVFGVLIALPLTEALPELVNKIITQRSSSDADSLLLLVAALVFSTFYWFELRRFIDDQDKFDKAIKAEQNNPGEPRKAGGLPLPKLLGSLIMVALVATTLRFANVTTLRAFVIANLLFWLVDLFGNIWLKLQYKPDDLASIQDKHPDEYEWYMTNIQPPRKGPPYSGINIAFFGLALVAAIVCRDHPIYVSLSIFAFTFVRHLFIRPYL
jgi:hypothetical protein